MSEQESTRKAEVQAKLRNPSYEIFMGLLSILSILNMGLLLFMSEQTLSAVLELVNIVLVIFFAMDFLFRFFTAPSKSEYFIRGYGWADLLSSLPFSQTNILRLFRLVKVYRLIKDYGVRRIRQAVIRDRADSALFTLLFISILMLEFGSLGLLAIEAPAPGANITDASDALWYMVVTMSTVGYGDQYPVTQAGRILGVIVILIGVGIFGTLTGYLANFFLSPSRKGADEDDDAVDGTQGAAPAEVASVEAQLAALKRLSAQQQKAIADLEAVLQRRDP